MNALCRSEISKNQIKQITKLQYKKYRQQEGLFIGEGIKIVKEFLNSDIQLKTLYLTQEIAESFKNYNICKKIITEADLKKISTLKTPQKVLGIFKIPSQKKPNQKGLIVALDNVSDPGNFGTIIRLCDWFGISHLLCSKNTVDCFNPKVIQATMGSLARVHINYVSLEAYLKQTSLPIYITCPKGENIYQTKLPSQAILIMGNESKGIHKTLLKYATHTLCIPSMFSNTPESLNVATATAIVLSEFQRSFFIQK